MLAQPYPIQYDTNGRMCNPALPVGCDGIDGVSFVNFKPSRRQLFRSSKALTRFPCPFARQHGVCNTVETAARLDRLFVQQRAVLRRATGKPYVEDPVAARIDVRLRALNLAIGTVISRASPS